MAGDTVDTPQSLNVTTHTLVLYQDWVKKLKNKTKKICHKSDSD